MNTTASSRGGKNTKVAGAQEKLVVKTDTSTRARREKERGDELTGGAEVVALELVLLDLETLL